MTKDIHIETDRLILRAARAEDAETITRAKQEVWGELQQWMSWAYDGEESLASTHAYIDNCAKDGGIPLVGFCRDSGQFVVATGLMKRGDIFVTGYWVAKDFLGKGYATEATEATLGFAFDDLNAETVGIGYLEGNDKSRRIIDKLGFIHTHSTEKSHARCSNGELLNEHNFEMTQDQWRQRCR